MVRRDRIEIISGILNLCSDGGVNKTKLVYGANLNFKSADMYIDLLTERGLLEVEQGSRMMYKTTDKGNEVLKGVESALGLLGEIQ